ncbi:TD and POZ domain-containing protein 4-like [Diachasmimorpha longicaudata]|uniref:TD and POZ domain-containing protein 4-like n=1 Tax=Diachasmimorpha longicaudata TaxID=58733 RepID=UPI0030B8AD84
MQDAVRGYSLSTEKYSSIPPDPIQYYQQHFKFRWSLFCFSEVIAQRREFTSSIVQTPTCKLRWQLIYDHDSNLNSNDSVTLFLTVVSLTSISNMTLRAQLCIPDCPETYFTTCTYSSNSPNAEFKNVSRSAVLSVSDDKPVDIFIQIDIPGDIDWYPLERDSPHEESSGRLTQHFYQLFKESKLSDVSVIAGVKIFRAHKIVLAARSSVFSAMFEDEETEEDMENEVIIKNMEPEVVQAMLEFFYSDKVENLKVELAYELLEAANKYDVEDLANVCVKFLDENINTENAAKIFFYGDLYHSEKLKQRAFDFIAKHLSEVVESQGYKEMEEEDPRLAVKLLRTIVVLLKSK